MYDEFVKGAYSVQFTMGAWYLIFVPLAGTFYTLIERCESKTVAELWCRMYNSESIYR